MVNVEIWASGAGSNADAIFTYFKDHPNINACSLACNRKEAGAFNIAKKHGKPSYYWSKNNWNASSILTDLKSREIDFVVLAGFLKLVPEEVTTAFEGRIVNVHPSLLPKYGGKNMYGELVHKAVLAQKESRTGITIHEVNAEFDKGKLLAQFTTKLAENEDLAGIKAKISILEQVNFAPIIEAWIKSKTTQ
jgi:phosphoribosylglycinamide formyltransferase-1